MRKLTLTIITVLLTASACRNTETAEKLSEIETYIEDRADSALTVLDSLSSQKIRGRKARAKFALLYSMALDKNYIDIVSDSIISPAVKWYRWHGTADEKLKTYYYLGCVMDNNGDREAAMECYIKAGQFADKASDDLALGRLYKAQYLVYDYIYDFDRAIEYAKKSAEHYLKGGDIDKYAGALENIANSYLIIGHPDSCAIYLEKVRKYWEQISKVAKSTYFENKIYLDRNIQSNENLLNTAHQYLKNVTDPEIVNWCALSEAYLDAGKADSSLVMIDNCRKYGVDYKTQPYYYIVLTEIYKSMGLYKEALEANEQYAQLADNTSIDIIGQDTKFIEERSENEAKIFRHRVMLIISIMGIAIIVLTGRVIVQRIRREKEKYRIMYSDAIIEKEALENTITKVSHDPESERIISNRLSILDKFIAAYITEDGEKDKEAEKELERLVSEKETFLHSTNISIGKANPELMKLLKEKGLTKNEINYCCLYVMGLNGKEIGNYIELQRHYVKYGVPIRAKLGLGEHDKNLGPYIQELAAALDTRGKSPAPETAENQGA